MADLNELDKEFKEYITTLQETSKGGKNKDEFLCKSQVEVYNFEQYVDYKEKVEKNPYFSGKRRIDALYVDKQKNVIHCIEFKIEKYSKINQDKDEIIEKFEDSFSILVNIFEKLNLNLRDYGFIFYVVYKDIKDNHFFNNRNLGRHLELESAFAKLKQETKLSIVGHSDVKVDNKSNFKRIYTQIFSDISDNC